MHVQSDSTSVATAHTWQAEAGGADRPLQPIWPDASGSARSSRRSRLPWSACK